MALHFAHTEFAQRLERLQAAMQANRLDAMFLFPRRASTGSRDMTPSASASSILVVKLDGRMELLTRSADLRQARRPRSSRISASGKTRRTPSPPPS